MSSISQAIDRPNQLPPLTINYFVTVLPELVKIPQQQYAPGYVQIIKVLFKDQNDNFTVFQAIDTSGHFPIIIFQNSPDYKKITDKVVIKIESAKIAYDKKTLKYFNYMNIINMNVVGYATEILKTDSLRTDLIPYYKRMLCQSITDLKISQSTAASQKQINIKIPKSTIIINQDLITREIELGKINRESTGFHICVYIKGVQHCHKTLGGKKILKIQILDRFGNTSCLIGWDNLAVKYNYKFQAEYKYKIWNLQVIDTHPLDKSVVNVPVEFHLLGTTEVEDIGNDNNFEINHNIQNIQSLYFMAEDTPVSILGILVKQTDWIYELINSVNGPETIIKKILTLGDDSLYLINVILIKGLKSLDLYNDVVLKEGDIVYITNLTTKNYLNRSLMPVDRNHIAFLSINPKNILVAEQARLNQFLSYYTDLSTINWIDPELVPFTNYLPNIVFATVDQMRLYIDQTEVEKYTQIKKMNIILNFNFLDGDSIKKLVLYPSCPKISCRMKKLTKIGLQFYCARCQNYIDNGTLGISLCTTAQDDSGLMKCIIFTKAFERVFDVTKGIFGRKWINWLKGDKSNFDYLRNMNNKIRNKYLNVLVYGKRYIIGNQIERELIIYNVID